MLRGIFSAASLIACLAAAPGVLASDAGDEVLWSAPGWYILRWTLDDVAYVVVKGPFVTEPKCNTALNHRKRQHRRIDDGLGLECRHLETNPP